MSDSHAAHRNVRPRPGGAELLACIEAYAAACVTAARRHDLAHTLADPERGAVDANPASSEPDVIARHAELMSALDDLTRTTLRAVPDPGVPVCTWQKGAVEVRGMLADGSRAVRVRYTPAQAIAAGAALIACGAVADTTSGSTLGPILPPFPTSPDHVAAAAQDTSGSPVEHDCQAAGTLTFAAVYGAPGVGQAWKCTECGRDWARLGERFYPAEEGAHILRPADCI
jgi:hypothetical protein